MITVFIFSGQQGEESGNTSRKFTVKIVQILTGRDIELDDPFINGVQLVIRKSAHFTVYAIGGFLIMNYFYTTDTILKKKVLYSIAYGGSYAITDEVHQSFVPGRNGNIFDVGIDTTGVIFGILIYWALRKIIEKVICNHKIKEV